MALTEKAIEKLRPIHGRRVELSDDGPGGVPGLRIRANTDGTKTFALIYRTKVARVQRRWTLPTRWTKGEYGVANARADARQALAAVGRGEDPADLKRADRDAMTFTVLKDSYLKVAKARKKTWPEDERILTTVAEKWGWKHRAVRDIRPRDVLELIESIAESAPVMANRVKAALGVCFKRAVKLGEIEISPTLGIEKFAEHRRERVLDADEIRTLWAACNQQKILRRDGEGDSPVISAPVARLLQLLITTGQRSGESASMRWADIDLPADWRTNRTVTGAWWTIPSKVTKNGRTHRVWLAATALNLLREAKLETDSQFVFASATAPHAHVGQRAKKAMAELKRGGLIAFDVRRHDLRRTMATMMRAAGVDRDSVATRSTTNFRAAARRRSTTTTIRPTVKSRPR